MKLIKSALVSFGAATLVAAAAAGSEASANATSVLDLEFNDAAGATVANDSSGMGHDGSIGAHLVMNGDFAHWDRHSPTEGIPYGFDHLISVPDAADGSLDPDGGDFTIELRFRTKEKFGNVMQKGQSHTVGGQVKLQIPKGKLSCMFKTPQGTATAGSGATLLNDNLWHTVRCERTPTYVAMWVQAADGTFVRTGKVNHVTGTLNNKKPWTFGGKSECDAVTVTCDYFSGDIDYVKMTKG